MLFKVQSFKLFYIQKVSLDSLYLKLRIKQEEGRKLNLKEFKD